MADPVTGLSPEARADLRAMAATGSRPDSFGALRLSTLTKLLDALDAAEADRDRAEARADEARSLYEAREAEVVERMHQIGAEKNRADSLQRQLDDARRTLQLAADVMYALDRHPGLLGHFLDNDENDGQRLREQLDDMQITPSSAMRERMDWLDANTTASPVTESRNDE